MKRMTATGMIGGAVLALSMTLAPAASAQSPYREVAQIQNIHFGQCLTGNDDESVQLTPCGELPRQIWDVPRGGVGQIRNIATNQCLTDVDTTHLWGDAFLRPCSDDFRQLWEVNGTGTGYIRNIQTGRFLKANDARNVYVGAQEEYYPLWAIN